MSVELSIPNTNESIECLLDEPDQTKSLIVLAHGAGAGMDHAFLSQLAGELNHFNLACLRFNFPYMQANRKSPGSPKPNIAAWNTVTQYALSHFNYPLFLAGKSYGGRMASHLLAENAFSQVKGVVYFGFPLHAPGRDAKDRAAHLDRISVPQLFLQGTKDSLANEQLISEVCSDLQNAQLKRIEDGDHSFKVKGMNHSEVIQTLALHTSNWVDSVLN